MASTWTIIILLATIRNINSYSGAFSSQSDFSHLDKIRRQSEIRDHCPLNCNCDNINNVIISCSFKRLRFFPPNIFPSVYHLNLVGNELVRLTYNTSLKALNTLNVSQNNISEINNTWIGSLTKLKNLDISKNSLHAKAIANVFQNITLLNLDLSKNALVSVSEDMFSHMNTLLVLNLSSNAIQNISPNSFTDLVNINTLDLSFNKLDNIQHEWFQNLGNLEKLILKQNNIQLMRNVVFSTLKNLLVLDLSENYIKSIGLLSFKGLFKLHFLNMSSNSILHFQEGVFRSLESLRVLDLSQNPFISLDNIFIHTKSLEVLFLKDLDKFKELTQNSLIGTQSLNLLDISGSKELSDINLKAFSYSQNLRILDLSNANLTNLKMGVFNNLQKIENLKLSGNPWRCDCHMYWLLMWLGEHINSHLFSPSDTFCNSPTNLKGQVLLDALDHSMICTNASIHYHTNVTKFKVGSPALLECKVEGNPLPSLTWITPQKEAFHWKSFNNQTKGTDILFTSTDHPTSFLAHETVGNSERGRFYLTTNGNLAINNVERGDGGFYVCIASNPLSYDSVSIRLTLDYEYLVHIKIISVLVGTATSFGFLLLTLVAVLIKMILKHFNIKCPCHNGNASPRTQQIKKILESMEHYKKQQLDRLRDNYNVQVQKIKDNCMQQMERLRESYSSQAERLQGIKDYGTLQIDRIRENYYSQVQRVRDYSASQIIRLRENYIYQRNRIRKFSAHHLYKLRENYKVQQQHLNKILENFNIESCRNVCHRTDSIVFEPDITLENVLVPKICLQTLTKETCDSYDNSSQISAYFTPDEAGSEISEHESDEQESFENASKLNSCQFDVVIDMNAKAVSTSSIPEHHTPVDKSLGVANEAKPCSNETIV